MTSSLAWRDDSRKALRIAHGHGPKAKIARGILAKKLRASPRAEAGYVRALLRVFSAAHRAVLRELDAGLESPEVRMDAQQVSDTFMKRLLAFLRPRVVAAFVEMGDQVESRNERAMSLIGITPSDAGVGAILAAARDRSVGLVERALRAYAADVRAVLTDAETIGLRVEAIRDLLVARGNVSLSRARLLAVDQTLSANAAVSKARQQAAGVTRFRWSTSRDEHVRGDPTGLYPNARPSHFALEGRVFDYDDPPPANTDGSPACPGEPIMCRCIAIPVIPEIEIEQGAELGMAAE